MQREAKLHLPRCEHLGGMSVCVWGGFTKEQSSKRTKNPTSFPIKTSKIWSFSGSSSETQTWPITQASPRFQRRAAGAVGSQPTVSSNSLLISLSCQLHLMKSGSHSTHREKSRKLLADFLGWMTFCSGNCSVDSRTSELGEPRKQQPSFFLCSW